MNYNLFLMTIIIISIINKKIRRNHLLELLPLSHIVLLLLLLFLCRTVMWDKNNTSPQGLQDVAAALEK